MQKCSEVATKLRVIADALDSVGENEISWPYLSLECTKKEDFKAIAAVWPRPFEKTIDFKGTSYEDFVIKYSDSFLLKIARNKVCTLVKEAQPAVYNCEPLLSPEEEEQIA